MKEVLLRYVLFMTVLLAVTFGYKLLWNQASGLRPISYGGALAHTGLVTTLGVTLAWSVLLFKEEE